ncbi:hypothetical protein BDV12DRAFT_191847 [Aspergillus spectabilis]
MSEFKKDLNNPTVYAQILSITSIDEVYDLTDKLQAEQGRKGHLLHLAKIEPYLNRLREYAAVIEVFMLSASVEPQKVYPDIYDFLVDVAEFEKRCSINGIMSQKAKPGMIWTLLQLILYRQAYTAHSMAFYVHLAPIDHSAIAAPFNEDSANAPSNVVF